MVQNSLFTKHFFEVDGTNLIIFFRSILWDRQSFSQAKEIIFWICFQTQSYLESITFQPTLQQTLTKVMGPLFPVWTVRFSERLQRNRSVIVMHLTKPRNVQSEQFSSTVKRVPLTSRN